MHFYTLCKIKRMIFVENNSVLKIILFDTNRFHFTLTDLSNFNYSIVE